MKIFNYTNKEVIFESEHSTMKETVEHAVKHGVSLEYSDLRGANLSGAIIPESNLMNADLSGANLSWANLTDSNLKNANLTDTILTEADLSFAILDGATISDENSRKISSYSDERNIIKPSVTHLYDSHVNIESVEKPVLHEIDIDSDERPSIFGCNI